MSGKMKHMERSRRSYRKRQELVRESARYNRIKIQTREIRKSRGAALAALVTGAKSIMHHKSQEK